MLARLGSLVLALALLAAALSAPLSAKDKKNATLPDYVVKAQTVLVVIDPNAGEPLDQPNANANARDNVEKALLDWGRLRPMMDGARTDLIIVVRTGSDHFTRPTVKGGPIDQRPGVGQTGDASTRIGGQIGHPPPLSDPSMNPQDRGPRISNEVGATEDLFAVYRGGGDDPLDSPAVWRYMAKDCLRAPQMTAVNEFRKALIEAEKQQSAKKP